MAHTPTTRCRAARRGRRTVAALVAVAVSVFAASDALGQPPQSRLGKPVTLVERTGLGPPMTMMAASSADGLQAFAWVKFRPKLETVPSGFGGPSSVIQARLRRAGGRLTRVQSLSPRNGRAFVPAIGVDRKGVVTAVWLQQVRRGNFRLVVSVRRPGGRFGRAVPIGRTRLPTIRALYPHVLRYDYGAEPALAVAADGSTVVAWRGSDALQIAVRRPGRCPGDARRACFSRPQDFPLGAEPNVVFGARDRAYVVWAGLRGAGAGVQLAVARVDGSFKPTRVSEAGVIASDPSVAVTPDGTAIVVWQNDHTSSVEVQAAVRSPTGMQSAPLTLSDRSRFSPGVTPLYGGSSPRIVANRQGEAIVVWQQATIPETGGGIVTAVWSSGSFGPSQVVEAGETYDPIMTVDGRGDAVLAYFRGPEGFFGDWLVRPPGGAFDPDQGIPGSPVFLVQRRRDAVTLGVRQGTEGERTRLYDILID